MKLKGKVAIITGGSSGIGLAAAKLFAKEGAKVVIAARNLDEGMAAAAEIRKSGGEASFIKADVSIESDIKTLIAETVRIHKKIDIMFNNAGIDLTKTVVETSKDELDRVLDVNLKGVFYGCKHAIPEMIKSGGGAVINTASIAGLVGMTDLAAYCASKGGVIALTKQVALDYAKNNVRVNCICPGVIKTPMVENYLKKAPNPKKEEKELADLHPLGRIGKPEEIAHVALFLASDDSSFVTGHALVADGGLTAQ